MHVLSRTTLSQLLVLVALALLPAAAEARRPEARREVNLAARGELRLVDPAVVGMDAEKLRAVDAAIERAIAAGVTPGAALAVGRKGRLVRLRGYGRLDWDPASPEVDAHSIFDLASLTKPIATTTAVMFLVQEKRLDLDAPLSRYLPEFRGVKAKRTMSARHLLEHRSGLPAGGPLAGVIDRESVPAFMAKVPLRAVPGRRADYSDYGMILLGVLVERIAREPLDAFVRHRLLEPMGLGETGFNPFTWSPAASVDGNSTSLFNVVGNMNALLARVAPTERTARGHLRGVVHDPLAAKLSGVAGHAGLFSSAHDLAQFAQLMLDHGRIDDRKLLDSALVARFTRPRSATSRYALGWEMAQAGGPAGDYFSRHGYGHTGYTGTSLWIDPDRELFVVLLTNRVNPSAAEKRHAALRRTVHDGVQRSLLALARVSDG
jgi:CubicO group peptidase (beta-lactamase class C family)